LIFMAVRKRREESSRRAATEPGGPVNIQ
jgi:hypothetical protein